MDNEYFTEAERFILIEVAELLDVPQAGPDDSFLDLHGDSLKAILLTAAIEERFGIVIDVADVFSATSLRALAEQVAELAPEGS